MEKKEIRFTIKGNEIDLFREAKAKDDLAPMTDLSYAKLIVLRYLKDKTDKLN